MLPGMFAGMIQEAVGYASFFNLTIICCVTTIGVSLAVIRHIDSDFGRKNNAADSSDSTLSPSDSGSGSPADSSSDNTQQ